MESNYVRFQLPASWAVCYNSFGDEDMRVADVSIENFWYYKEDLLWLQSMRSTKNPDSCYELDPAGWLVDVGWYPDSDPNGAYSLHVFRLDPEEDGWPIDPPQFRSRNRYQIRAVLEYIVNHIAHPGDNAETSRQRMVDLQLLHDKGQLDEFLTSAGYS
jgi:hypothetical protein